MFGMCDNSRKIELLYAKATGGNYNPTPEEKVELMGYKVDSGESKFFATKANITAYVNAMEGKPIKRSFYDWCIDNNKADRRRKGSSEAEMKSWERGNKGAVLFLGWLPRAGMVYTIFNGAIPVPASIVIGIILSLIAYKLSKI